MIEADEVLSDQSSPKKSTSCCPYTRKKVERNVYTISDLKLADVTEEEQKFIDQEWKEFKEDVSMKTLIDKLDRGIKRRRRLYISDHPTETQKIADFRKTYSRYKPIKYVAIVLYILLPLLEKPGWCIKNKIIDTSTSHGYWYC